MIAFHRNVAAHVLRTLAVAQARGRVMHLDDVAGAIGVRHDDVREVVTRLHQEGHVDAKRMRLTMTGLVLASSMRPCKLNDVRASMELDMGPESSACVA